MSAGLNEYQQIIGADATEELYVLADRVRSRRCQHFNATPVGGDVAELLTRLIPLMRELGIESTWDVIKGDDQFFAVTKALNQALGGRADALSPAMLDTYRATMEMNLRELRFVGDVIFVHDPQPAGLIAQKKHIGGRWVWRSHMDLSAPAPPAWDFLSPLVQQYDVAIVSTPDFAPPVSIPQYVVTPSIDPLSDKNKELDAGYVREALERHRIDPDRPSIIQVSRLERLKDPMGVIAAYRMIKGRHDCQLVLAGEAAADDPESFHLVSEIQEQAAADADIHFILLPPFSDLEVNALVRGATIVMQKSIREGFGLAVSEAMWKRKPVIGTAAGGIRQQVVNGFTGYLVDSPETAAERASQLLGDPDLCNAMGENGRLYVSQNFLITRQLRENLLVLLALDYPDQDVIFLA